MNKEKLVNSLMEQDLNKFEFKIYAKENEEGKKEYTYCLGNSMPSNSDYEYITTIGGDYEENYTKEFIKKEIEEGLDFWGLA